MATKAGTAAWRHTERFVCIAVTITAPNAARMTLTRLLLVLYFLAVTDSGILCSVEAVWHYTLYNHSKHTHRHTHFHAQTLKDSKNMQKLLEKGLRYHNVDVDAFACYELDF